jgi:arylsulfatase
VPCIARWPDKIKPGTIENGMFSGLDWLPTLVAAAGNPNITEQLLKGVKLGDREYKNHLDGYNQLDYLTGKTDKSARNEFYYFNDDGDLVSMRYGDWKLVFEEQRAPGGWAVWQDPFTTLRVPKMFNLRMDPYERADIVSDQFNDWMIKNNFIITGGMLKATDFLETFAAYPPSQRPASFNIDYIRKGVDKKIDESFKKRGLE